MSDDRIPNADPSGAPAPESAHEHAAVDHAQFAPVKETIIALTISFTMAFVFRGFGVEPFMIPTGSMAPTLLGAHERITNPSTGYTWTLGPFFQIPGSSSPLPQQGGKLLDQDLGDFVTVDPMSHEVVSLASTPSKAGDRIFVLKYIPYLFQPERFDVTVFKNPQSHRTPGEAIDNFIKRLVGLPNEQIAIVDGDVFARPLGPGIKPAGGTTAWSEPGWRVCRKPPRVQRAVWQNVFDSTFTPLESPRADATDFISPWLGLTVDANGAESGSSAWQIAGRSAYTFQGPGVGRLRWNTEPVRQIDDDRFFRELFYPREVAEQMRHAHLLFDNTPFNQIFPLASTRFDASPQNVFFPVADVRVAFAVESPAGDYRASITVACRGMEFRGRLEKLPEPGRFRPLVESRPQSPPDASWTLLGEGSSITPHGPVNLEFWHVDQSLSLWIDGERAAYAEYDWSPADRIAASTGHTLEEILAEDRELGGSTKFTALARSSFYRKPEVWADVNGPCTLHRVAIARDLHYQAGPLGPRGTHPLTTQTLGPGQYFLCGDNSPASYDCRGWETVNPWIADRFDVGPGVVPEQLLIGRAFVVYFPAPEWKTTVAGYRRPVPDVGRVRWIW